MSRLCEYYPGICLTTEEKAQINLSQGNKTSVRLWKNLSQGKENLSQGYLCSGMKYELIVTPAIPRSVIEVYCRFGE